MLAFVASAFAENGREALHRIGRALARPGGGSQ
jgi:hypothetical protein